MKETAVINHIDESILSINRRHAKKFSSSYYVVDQPASERGYEGFDEVAKDIETIIDLLWVTGTPSLQIPYLISLAVMVNSYIPDFPFSPKQTFSLLKKLDFVFASLLLGHDAETGAPLSGFDTRHNIVSMTEKVRIKSIAESCRVTVVEALEREDDPDGDKDEDDDDDGDEMTDDDNYPSRDLDEGPSQWQMEAARVYERTIQLLGDELGRQGEVCGSSIPSGPA
ncbi:hypothetical protein MPDQ_004692 [Monascus purpureus]|uniref:Uncharacterized protein n=1 Tax=Monascus purpureus TaxID=5098 RepID=A0A507QLK4_MONPU|nr:hypothetical protein MPDQ_004692 [Monascus purpureus]